MRLRGVTAVLLAAAMSGCGLGETAPVNGNGGDAFGSIFVLNQVGRTIGRFELEGDQLRVAASPITLPPNFDGDSFTILGAGFATSVSVQGGSQVVFGDLRTGELDLITFAGAEGPLADPSKVTLVDDPFRGVEAWVAGRGTNAVYRIRAGERTATVFNPSVGAFVERVLPIGEAVAAIDANLDDESGIVPLPTLGPSRVFLVDRVNGATLFTIPLNEAVGATNGIFNQGELLVLAAGSFSDDGAGGLQPDGNGSLVFVDVGGLDVRQTLPLGGNGLGMSPGADANLYITRTSDLVSTDVLAWSFFQDRWERSPENPLQPRDASGASIGCRIATALQDGRILCATFSVAQPGNLYLLDASGAELSRVASGVGSTDIAIR